MFSLIANSSDWTDRTASSTREPLEPAIMSSRIGKNRAEELLGIEPKTSHIFLVEFPDVFWGN